ncbi:MAG: tRNA uridine-5-carboxymethylaminomethyl(34) synthesis GTPase MnmE [Deltaproteobacteria bacterium]|nr:tRNA uridine-5-carboxymethylaminomethyl(34) synthesis GTPase MnmE [Deltaproteobacteria bacterium]
MSLRDTIAAIATPPGVGGIGVIRISGPEAEGIALRLFRPSSPLEGLVSHRLHHGRIVSPETGDVLDEALVTLLKAPRSFTGEDTVELHCHGGPYVLRTVLEEILRLGARLAERGEFTKRAFLNDRLDLAQAEAVLDLINARTREGLQAAVGGLEGRLSGRIDAIRGRVIDLLAGIEAAIDFTAEDGMEPPDGGTAPLDALIDEIRTLAASYHRGKVLREGIGVVIAGRPNVGKSSLLNRLLGQRRAIVTPVPGTTRDFIEETVDIGGIPVRLTDTAGIRPPGDAVEEAGIELVWERIAGADIVLMLLDGSAELAEDDLQIIGQVREKPLLAVINKRDLPERLDVGRLKGLLPPSVPPVIRISAKYGEGLESLEEAIRSLALATPSEGDEVTISHLRHRVALEAAAEHLQLARDGMRDGIPPELTAIDLRGALEALGEITGRTTTEDILASIFANFCVGK